MQLDCKCGRRCDGLIMAGSFKQAREIHPARRRHVSLAKQKTKHNRLEPLPDEYGTHVKRYVLSRSNKHW